MFLARKAIPALASAWVLLGASRANISAAAETPTSQTTSTMPSASTAPTATSASDFTFFYKNPSPERVAELLRYFNGLEQPLKLSSQPPIVGFLAAAFGRYAADIDKMIPAGLSPSMQGVVAGALRLAGQEARAQSVVQHLKSTGAAVPDLAHVPTSLDAVEATGPSEFDLFWGASFATGDPRFVSKILDHFVSVANAGDNADDMVAIARVFGTAADFKWVVQKRGADKATELIRQSSALWALNSNAMQHEFVRTVIANYIGAHGTEPAAKAFLALAGAYGHYDLTKVLTTNAGAPQPSAIVNSPTVNIGYLSQILDDLGRHAGRYPPHFAFPDDEVRAKSDVSTLGDLLDSVSKQFSNNAPFLLRIAMLHAIGFNLDVADSFDKARASYSALLSLTPEDREANFRYGAFLASTTRKGEGIPYLEKAKSLGVVGADYWLGWSYMALNDRPKAIAELSIYVKNVPTDQNAVRMLDAVRNGPINFQEGKPSP